MGITGITALAANGQQKPQQLPETVVEAKRYKDIVPGETNTATKSDTPIIELPQSVSSVNRAEIEQRGAQSAAEAVLHVPPWLRRGNKIDRTRQTLYGTGFGGLFAMHILFTQPEAFQTYIASSPSVWWNNRYILTEEKAFTEKLAEKPVNARLFIGVGEFEQSLTPLEAAWPDKERDEHALKIGRRRMVDNTRERCSGACRNSKARASPPNTGSSPARATFPFPR